MLDIIVMPSRGLEHDYRTVLHRARSLGYTLPTPAQQQWQNQLIRGLKYAGIWSKLDIFYPLANNGSKEFATIDWVTPTTHQITIVNSCTWTANAGFTGNGVDMYLDTNYNPSTMGVQYVQDNASRIAWINAVSGTVLDGTSSGAINSMRLDSSTTQRINGAVLSAAADLSGTGLKSLNRTSSSNVEVFNNTTQSSRTSTSAAISNVNQLILRQAGNYASHTVSVYGMGASLVSENTALNQILSTYMASL